ncbi:MAG: ABC transporter substrate-binding protein [Xanthobacteraceae bacterium]
MSIRSMFVKCAFAGAVLALATLPIRAQQLAKIRVVAQGIANFAPLLVAREKGIFKDYNLDVSWNFVTQGALGVEAVFGRSAELAGNSVIEPLIARGNGLDIVYLLNNTRIRPTPPDNSGIVVRTADAINGPKDLVGKRISAGLINGPNHVHLKEWLMRGGVDPASIQYFELPFPQMTDALLQNRLDAVWSVEPFLTLLLKSGQARVIAYPYAGNVPNMDIAAFQAKESWIKANPDVARRLHSALERATKDVEAMSKEERDDWISKYTGVKVDIVKEINLPIYVTEFNVPALQANLDILVRQKLTKPFNINDMLWKP